MVEVRILDQEAFARTQPLGDKAAAVVVVEAAVVGGLVDCCRLVSCAPDDISAN